MKLKGKVVKWTEEDYEKKIKHYKKKYKELCRKKSTDSPTS
jgi:hypothetical protein